MSTAFETKLVTHLDYRGPWILCDMLTEYLSAIDSNDSPPLGNWHVFDLGCGSGLCGKVFYDYTHVATVALDTTSPAPTGDAMALLDKGTSGTLSETALVLPSDATYPSLLAHLRDIGTASTIVGIDISQRMVDISRDTGLYDLVICGDLSDTLSIVERALIERSLETAFDMVIVADTFIYIGALSSVFASIRKILSPRGLLLFSVEDLDSSPMALPTIATPGHSTPSSDHPVTTFTVSPSSTTDIALPASIDSITWQQTCLDTNGEPVGAVPGWGCRLLSSARFAHSHRYIEALAGIHGFHVARVVSEPLRKETGRSLPGLFYILQKL